MDLGTVGALAIVLVGGMLAGLLIRQQVVFLRQLMEDGVDGPWEEEGEEAVN